MRFSWSYQSQGYSKKKLWREERSQMQKAKALDLAAFFAEYEIRMKKMNRPKIAEFSRKQMIKYSRTYVNTELTE
ncbi:hypothetical protein [Bacillus velezensis]|uniref:hypothetical protein n=1 Tax=Bacillus velezensis TaxID=492670 RepID=UPI001D0EA2FE|nr:hypothetical protein [Bacillus velezensis]